MTDVPLFPDGLPERIRSKIELDRSSGCWLWTGYLDRSGYGRTRRVGSNRYGTHVGAHRVVYTELVGDIPEGLHLDHLCRVPACVNPAHLEPVTPKENTRRSGNWMAARIANAEADDSRCAHGHLFNSANTYVTKCGKRQCRTCNRIRHKDAYRRRSLAGTDDGRRQKGP